MKLIHDKLLSSFAFNCNLRHYIEVALKLMQEEGVERNAMVRCIAAIDNSEVGRCRFTLL